LLNRSPKRRDPARESFDEVRKPRKACASETRRRGSQRGRKLRSAGERFARSARQSAGEPCPGSRVQPAGAGSLGGRNVRRALGRGGVSARRDTDSPGEQSSGAGLRGMRLAARPARPTGRRAGASRGAPIPGRNKALKMEPQERSGWPRGHSGGAAGSKPPRAWKVPARACTVTNAEGGRWRGLDPSRGAVLSGNARGSL